MQPLAIKLDVQFIANSQATYICGSFNTMAGSHIYTMDIIIIPLLILKFIYGEVAHKNNTLITLSQLVRSQWNYIQLHNLYLPF